MFGRTKGPVIEAVSAIGGVVVAIGALVVSHLAHRHQVARAAVTGQTEAEQAALAFTSIACTLICYRRLTN
ncbi:hypothetical protein RKD23_007731 [Streptomyces sp. SAI-170]